MMKLAWEPAYDRRSVARYYRRQVWQTVSVGIRLRFAVDWALHDQRALAWTTVSGW
jgi:hypothetical protein